MCIPGLWGGDTKTQRLPTASGNHLYLGRAGAKGMRGDRATDAVGQVVRAWRVCCAKLMGFALYPGGHGGVKERFLRWGETISSALQEGPVATSGRMD